MKKSISFVVAFIIGNALFAQSTKYTEFMAQAQKYEQEKKWVHALGAYYDAVETANVARESLEAKRSSYSYLPLPEDDEEYNEKDSELQEASNAYKKLSEVIEVGNPGYGEFDDFSMYDGWIEIMQEYEKYWSENIPKAIRFSDLKKVKMNMENRKISYSLGVDIVSTKKYLALAKVFSEGKEKAYKNSWASYLRTWPTTSVYNSEDDKKVSKKNGIPFIKIVGENYSSNLNGNVNYLAFLMGYFKLSSSYWISPYARSVGSEKYVHPYEIKFKIIDENNNSLFESELIEPGAVEFTVSLDVAKIIESKKIKFVPIILHLRYGTISDFDRWEKKLETLELPVSKVQTLFE
ncbi:MAG: hypothetical protein IJ558_06090 [Treponema sp.]|nr:hypothetical protein [Treponema sp.]